MIDLQDIELTAHRSSIETYNETIIKQLIYAICEEHNIPFNVRTYTGSTETVRSRSKEELCVALVEKLARDKAEAEGLLR